MKIKKSSIILFVVAVILMASSFVKVENLPVWQDAKYVKDAKVLPENEGKFIAISGNLETIEYAKDPLVGVSFKSPLVTRKVKEFKWLESKDEWELQYVHEGQSSNGFEEGKVTGRVKIGEFELDSKLIKKLDGTQRDVCKDDFSDDDIVHMNDTGHFINEDFKCYYSTGPADYRNVNKNNKWIFKDWSDTYLVSWMLREAKKDDTAIIVGIQKGNKLTYCNLNSDCAMDKFMDEATFNAEEKPSMDSPWISRVLAVICAGIGVMLMLKDKKKKQA